MHKPQSFILSFILAIFLSSGVYIFTAKPSYADVVSTLSAVFKNGSVVKETEIEQIQAKNIQTMSLLSASVNPSALEASSTSDMIKTMKTNASMVDGKAFTNENSSVVDGPAGTYIGEPVVSDRISLYTVRKGDTLEQVAKMYGVTPSTILWANDMKRGDTLKPDQVLVILPISGIKYTIKKGDTLASITKQYKADIEEIKNFNNIDENTKLAVGDEIIIPDVEGNIAASSGTGSTKPSTGKISTVGYFTKPIVGGVRTQGLHGHNGVDLASYYGAPILAAASGKVIVSRVGGWGGGYGNYVVIQHSNGTQTLYAHMSSVSVSAGQTVSKGQQIGKMGSTGQSTGVHLHFEVRGGKNPF